MLCRYYLALGVHRSEEGFNYLITRVGHSIEPLRARPVAISGLAHSAEWQTERLRNQAIEEFSKFFDVVTIVSLHELTNKSMCRQTCS